MARAAEKPELTGEILYGEWKDEDGKVIRTKEDIAAWHSLTYGQVAGRIWRYEQTLKEGAPPEKPHLFLVNLGAPIEETGDAIVVSDIQAPTTDLDWARLVVPVAQQYHIRRLILNGDSLNVDWLSRYPQLERVPKASDEIAAVAYLLEEWQRWFEDIIFLPGNHEDRFLKANVGSLEIGNLVQMFGVEPVRCSNFDHMTLHTEHGDWFICHGRNYSVDQLKVANEMAQKFQAHIVMGHQHHLAMGWDRYKRYILVDNGGLFDPKKMAFVSLRASKHNNMQRGFCVLSGGFPILMGPEPYTNWKTVLQDEQAQPAVALAA